MSKLIKAYTKRDSVYPGFINISEEADGTIVLTVRSDPTIKSGAYICGFPFEKGQLGRCTPGDDHCNNYCNMAPQKGPMADHPISTLQTKCGDVATIRLSAEEWYQIREDFSE